MRNLFLFLSLVSFEIFSSEMDRVHIDYEDLKRYFLIHEPDTYNSSNPTNLVIGLHGYTGTATGFEKETTGGFNRSADEYGFIAAYPQGEFFYDRGFFFKSYVSSWNDLTGSRTKAPNDKGEICAADAPSYNQFKSCKGKDVGRCAWASCLDDIGFIKDIIINVKSTHNIDKVYVVGMSNGGMMAHAFACKHPELVDGVLNVVGLPHLGLNCIPTKPVNYIVYAGFNDDIVPPVNIVSWDKYYYEPMENVINEWKVAFNCEKLQSNKSDSKYIIHEQEFSECNNDVKIISLLNMDGGHTWPGIEDDDAGNCRSNDQSEIYFPKCKNVNNLWGNNYLLPKLLNL